MPPDEKPMRVVVGVDFSEPSMAAARWSARWLSDEAELVLVHALVVPEMDLFLANQFPLPPSILENARIGAERRLKELSASMAYPRTWSQIREGRPSEVIAQVAREFEASLVVVGKHGEGGRARGYPGRTADDLVRSSPVPVLLANQPTHSNPKRILVALTFSSVTPFIIEWTAKLAERFGSEVHAIHVVGSAVLSHVLSMAAVTQGKAPMSKPEIDRVFAEERDQWTCRLVDAGVSADRVTSEVVFGEVSEALLAAAKDRDAEMIVMGSHAGPIRRVLLGSAASAVVRNADVSVLVVLEPESTPAK